MAVTPPSSPGKENVSSSASGDGTNQAKEGRDVEDCPSGAAAAHAAAASVSDTARTKIDTQQHNPETEHGFDYADRGNNTVKRVEDETEKEVPTSVEKDKDNTSKENLTEAVNLGTKEPSLKEKNTQTHKTQGDQKPTQHAAEQKHRRDLEQETSTEETWKKDNKDPEKQEIPDEEKKTQDKDKKEDKEEIKQDTEAGKNGQLKDEKQVQEQNEEDTEKQTKENEGMRQIKETKKEITGIAAKETQQQNQQEVRQKDQHRQNKETQETKHEMHTDWDQIRGKKETQEKEKEIQGSEEHKQMEEKKELKLDSGAGQEKDYLAEEDELQDEEKPNEIKQHEQTNREETQRNKEPKNDAEKLKKEAEMLTEKSGRRRSTIFDTRSPRKSASSDDSINLSSPSAIKGAVAAAEKLTRFRISQVQNRRGAHNNQ